MVFRPACLPLLASLLASSGCSVLVTKAEFDTVQSQNRVLREQNQAQLAEIANLKVHSTNTEDQLMLAEQRVAALEEQTGLDRRQLVNYQREREQLHQQVKGLANASGPLSPESSRRIAEISQRLPSLRFDPQTGVGRLDVDILFDTGRTELKAGASHVLNELATVLKSPEGRDLKVLVVGHTDDRQVAKKPVRDVHPNNFSLSTGRAQAVVDHLRHQGLDDQRLGLAGFGAHQPVAPNVSNHDRQKNRRVEIFVMVPEVPVVGWTDSMPGLY